MIIKNIWKGVKLYCGCHGERVEMAPNEKGSSLFYSCPKYYKENRSDDERACFNRVKIDDYQDAVERVCRRIAENEKGGVVENLEGMSWSAKGVAYKIIEHADGKIGISAVNRAAGNR